MVDVINRRLDSFFRTLDDKIEKSLQNHLKNVYSTLALCLFVAAFGCFLHISTEFLKGGFLTAFGSIVLMLLLYATPDSGENEKLRLAYLLGFAGLSGLSTGPLLDLAITIDPSIVATAFMGTSVVFGCFTLAALYAPDRKYLYLGGTLLSLMSTMFWMALFNVFFGSHFIFQLNLYVGLAVMCGFVLYDTQIIMEKCRRGDRDYVWHAVDLFVDFMGIFRRILIILMQKEDQRKKKSH